MKLQKNVLLKNYTTFLIGGPAQYFLIAKTKEDIISGLKMAREKKWPYFILGGGSNLLISDKGFKGLVVKIQDTKYKIQNTKMIVGAGTPLRVLVNVATRLSLTGLEWAAGIPGTLGGAVLGNAGAFGRSMKDVVEKVEALDDKDLSLSNYNKRKCEFGYRESLFKKRNNLVILSAVLELKKGNKKEIQKKVKQYLAQRKETQALNYLSAGSVFKNPQGKSAGELIEKAGLKGKRIGAAQISEKHANFIINVGNAKAKDVKELISLVEKEVKKKFGVVLEKEIIFL